MSLIARPRCSASGDRTVENSRGLRRRLALRAGSRPYVPPIVWGILVAQRFHSPDLLAATDGLDEHRRISRKRLPQPSQELPFAAGFSRPVLQGRIRKINRKICGFQIRLH